MSFVPARSGHPGKQTYKLQTDKQKQTNQTTTIPAGRGTASGNYLQFLKCHFRSLVDHSEYIQ